MLRRPEPLLGLVLAAVLGCALRVVPEPIAAHLDWPLGEAVAANGARLGVGPFADARPVAERKGSAPPLQVRWRGLLREGENRIGDAAFSGAVAEGVRGDAVATLARSGDFAEVRLIEFDGGAWPEGSGLDYALVARVEEFAGRQHQRSELSPFWIGWIRNRYEPPVGRVRIHYRLYDSGGLVWQGRVETRHESPGASINGAVLEAMALNSEDLAGRLHVATHRGAESRVLPTRVLDGCRLGPRGIARVMDDVVLAFQREAGLRLALSVEPWRSPRGADLEQAFRAVRAIAPPPGGIVVALVPLGGERSAWRPDMRYGIADPFGSHAVVGCTSAGAIRAVTAIHEIGHLLGAVHVQDRSSVMHTVAEFDGRFFDPLNRKILHSSRMRPFGEPLPAPLSRRLDAIYRAAARFPERVEAADLQAAQAALRDVSASPPVGSAQRGSESPASEAKPSAQ
ncbi:MAG: hypothetical protein V3V67_14705 [Myxococcota bacterium]